MTSPGPELVIGLVGAVGTDLPLLAASLERWLADVNYSAVIVRLSHLLHEIDAYAGLVSGGDQEIYVNGHMDAGNDLRQRTQRNDALALLGIVKIRVARQESRESDDAEDEPLSRTAFILNSLKRPEEVATLRSVYGNAFFLVAAYSARDRRRDHLAARIAESQNKEASQCRPAAERLIDRDEYEQGLGSGQDIRDTFPTADAFVDMTDRTLIDDSVRRLISILFGHPFETPTRDEVGMQHAYAAALRSADLSRQVGYAACTPDGQILATGTNEVAKAGGGSYWPGDSVDFRDFRFVERDEPNAEMKLAILKDLLLHLQSLGLLAGVKIDDPFISRIARESRGTRLMNITEFGRAVHAEMAVVTDAARRGLALAGATMYGTTFPCHNCAKHIVAAGIARVVYIEPYPKSQVSRLFPDSIAVDRAADPGQVLFQPFVGIAPTRFRELFSMVSRKDSAGHVLVWAELKQTATPRLVGEPGSYVRKEVAAVEALSQALTGAHLTLRANG